MRTTIRIEDGLMRELKERAVREKSSLTELVNQVLRNGMAADKTNAKSSKRKFRQKTYDMGQPRFDVDKALSFAGELEDEEILKVLAANETHRH